MQSDDLCSRCRTGKCLDQNCEIECPLCLGVGCEHCTDGRFAVDCPKAFVADLAGEINIASLASNGLFPAAGGSLDQTNWFLECWTALENDRNMIQSEKIKQHE